MCLAIPGKILDIDTSCSLRMATVDFGGIHKSICIQYVDAEPGDFILAHAGMAITRLDSEEAEGMKNNSGITVILRHYSKQSDK